MPLAVRPARAADLPAIDAIYEPYVRDTAITFDLEMPSPAARREQGVGRKLGRLWDVRWYQRVLRPVS